MLSFLADRKKKKVTFEFREMWTDKLIFTETFDYIDAINIAADIMLLIKGKKAPKKRTIKK